MHLGAQDACQHLTSEAEAEDGDVRLDRTSHQGRLAWHERLRIVERGELGTERNDEVVSGRINLAVLDVDPQRLDARSVAVEPLGDEPRRRGFLVLEDQRSQWGGGSIDR